MRAIARQLGCSSAAVAARVHRYGLTKPASPPPLAAQVVEALVRLYSQERLDLRQVAARSGVPRDRVAVELRAAGVRLRKRGARPQEHLNPLQLRADYEAGATLRSLALREATADGAVREALVQAGAVIRSRGRRTRRWHDVLTPAFLQEHYIKQRQSLRTIARSVGCAPETVRVALEHHGISRRHVGLDRAD